MKPEHPTFLVPGGGTRGVTDERYVTTTAASRTRGAAAALIIEEERVLLVERTYGHPWQWVLPGGCIDPGESPLEACRRELAEELSCQPHVHTLVVVDWVPSDPSRPARLQWIFAATLPRRARIQLPAGELQSYRWTCFSEIKHYLPPHAARRVCAAWTAAHRGTTSYLEHGHAVLPEVSNAR